MTNQSNSQKKKTQQSNKIMGKNQPVMKKGPQPRESAAVAYGGKKPFREPRIKSKPNGSTNIEFEEYIGEVAMTNGFATTQFSCNPGLAGTFPWLSGRAQGYEKYKFRRLSFKYETEASSAQTGAVMLVPDYDAADAAPTTKIQAMAYEDRNRDRAWSPFEMKCSQKNLNALPQYYIRNGTLAANLDIKTYDVANLFLCTSGTAAVASIGELWVCYSVDLIAPVTEPFDPLSAKIVGGGALSATVPFGVAPVITGPLPVTVDSTGTTLTFPQGFVGLATIFLTGTATGATWTGTPVTTQLNTVTSGSHVIDTWLITAPIPGSSTSMTGVGGTVTASQVRLSQYLPSLA